MEPLRDWPSWVSLPEQVSYSEELKQLVCLGRMTDDNKRELLEQLSGSNHDPARQAVENLYQLTRLGSSGDMVL
jgi:hypothetical protein